MPYTTCIDKHGDPNARGAPGQLPSVVMHFKDGTVDTCSWYPLVYIQIVTYKGMLSVFNVDTKPDKSS